MKKLATFIFMGIFIIIFVPINTASQANHIDRLQKEIADHQEKIKGYYQKIEEIRKHGQEEISNLEKKLGKTDDPGQKEYLRKRIEEIRKRLANDSYHWGHPAWTHITDYKKYIENSKNRIEEIKKKVKVLPEPVFYDEKEAKVSDVGRVLTPPPPSRKEKSVSITGSNSIKAGQTLQYKAWLHYTDGTKRDVTSTIKWMVYSLSGSGSSARVSKGRLRVLKVSPKGTLVQLSVKYSSSQHRISLDFTKDVRVIYWKKMLVKLSLGKPARQSSTGYGGTAQLAVDGNTDGNYFSGSTTHTNHEKNPWWEVDLGAVYKLENVLVYNRTDSCSERLDNFQVLVSVEPFPNSPVTANGYTIKGWIVQKAQNINRINLGKTQGRYVRIQLLGQNYLSLAEVIVNGVSTETDPTRTATTGEAKVSDVGRVTTTPSSDAGCRTLAQVYTDGSGDRRTKKLGGNYAAIRLDSLDDDQTIRVEAVSGRLTYVTLHARYQGGYWRTIYKGPKTEFPVGQYIASYKKDRNCTHVNVSVNGAHEKYDPVACRANLLVCSAPDKPGRVLTPPELPTGGTVTTGELRNIQKKVLVLRQLYQEAYQDYQNLLKQYGPSVGGYSVGRPVEKAFAKYKLLIKMYEQAKQEYIQSNQGRDDLLGIRGKVVTKKMKEEVLSQLLHEAYKRYKHSLRIRGRTHPATRRAFSQFRWIMQIKKWQKLMHDPIR